MERNKNMKKTYVLDTNILMSSPEILKSLEDNDIVITDTVLEELDNHKDDKKNAERAYNARVALRAIKALNPLKRKGNKVSYATYAEGVPTEGGGTFRVEMDHLAKLRLDVADPEWENVIPEDWDLKKPDNRIICAAKNLMIDAIIQERKTGEHRDVILITNDGGMYIKANCCKLPVEEFKKNEVDLERLYTGRAEYRVPDEIITKLRQEKAIDIPDIIRADVIENEYVTLISESGMNGEAPCKVKSGELIYLDFVDIPSPYGIMPRKLGQKFLWDALFDPDIPLVVVRGCAGTGKTYLTTAAGLDYVNEGSNGRTSSRKMIMARSRKLGEEDEGFLPGTEQDKVSPLLMSFFDNMEAILGQNGESDAKEQIDDFIASGEVELRSMAYMRGRSIRNSFIVIDEAQNCTPAQMLEIVTRAGEGSKVVILGDIEQIDDPHLSKRSNGLVFLSERMKGSKLCAQIELYENEAVRSPLAIEGAKKLKL